VVADAGDALGIYPQNNLADVDAFLKAVQHSGLEMVPLPRWAYHQVQTTGKKDSMFLLVEFHFFLKIGLKNIVW